jgi:hypothetical protein
MTQRRGMTAAGQTLRAIAAGRSGRRGVVVTPSRLAALFDPLTDQRE